MKDQAKIFLALGLLLQVGCEAPMGIDTGSEPISAKSGIYSATASDWILVGAGDIAADKSLTGGNGRTAALIRSMITASPSNTSVFTAGDNAYPDGTTLNFADYYEKTWGTFKLFTRPSAGNHEYHVTGAQDYFNYFGLQARGDASNPPNDPTLRYYSYDVGSWHILMLDSMVAVNDYNTGLPAQAAQVAWVRADLAAHPNRCTLAIWHYPRYSSGDLHGSNKWMNELYQVLYDYKVDLNVVGHEHNYERFAPQDANGIYKADGVREILSGMGGGGGDYPITTPIANSQFQYTDANKTHEYGVLKLTLHPTSYEWQQIIANPDGSVKSIANPDGSLRQTLDSSDDARTEGGSTVSGPVLCHSSGAVPAPTPTPMGTVTPVPSPTPTATPVPGGTPTPAPSATGTPAPSIGISASPFGCGAIGSNSGNAWGMVLALLWIGSRRRKSLECKR